MKRYDILAEHDAMPPTAAGIDIMLNVFPRKPHLFGEEVCFDNLNVAPQFLDVVMPLERLHPHGA